LQRRAVAVAIGAHEARQPSGGGLRTSNPLKKTGSTIRQEAFWAGGRTIGKSAAAPAPCAAPRGGRPGAHRLRPDRWTCRRGEARATQPPATRSSGAGNPSSGWPDRRSKCVLANPRASDPSHAPGPSASFFQQPFGLLKRANLIRVQQRNDGRWPP